DWRGGLLCGGGLDLRRFASQGEQRLTVLALLLAEARLLDERRGVPPLLLLDDVLSELDTSRRAVLSRLVGGAGQTVVTATQRSALPVEPAQLVEVELGSARGHPPRRGGPLSPAARERRGCAI